MSQRITKRDLEAVCQRINRTVNGREMQPYQTNGGPEHDTTSPDYDPRFGGWKPVPDCYHLDGAYGGYALYRMVSDGGSGVHDVFGCGHMPKRELYDRMQSFLRGCETCAA